jgi:hypothetical protein
LLFNRDEGYRRDPNDGKKATAADRVREMLDEEPDLTVAELTARTGYAERTVRRALDEVAAGVTKVGPNGEKQYALPADPEADQ